MGDRRRVGNLTGLLSFLALPAFLISCSSSPSHQNYDMMIVDRKSDRQVKVEYDGKCAMAVANGRLWVPGDRQFMLERNGKTYYFASQAAKDKFVQDLQANIDSADKNWQDRAMAHAGI